MLSTASDLLYKKCVRNGYFCKQRLCFYIFVKDYHGNNNGTFFKLCYIISCNATIWSWQYQPFWTDQFSSVAQSCPTLCDPKDCSTPGLPVHHQLPEPTQTHVHWVGDAIQPSHPLSFHSAPPFNHSQHEGLFKWVSPSHQVAKVLEFQLQHQSFQWISKTDFL